MAMHKLDRIFKKKLGSHVTQPTADAWTKLESMLAQPKKKPVWFFYKVAAAILLLLSAAFIVYKYQMPDYERVNIALVDSLNINDTQKIAFEHPKEIEIKTKSGIDSAKTPKVETKDIEEDIKKVLVPITINEIQLANNTNKPKKVSTNKSIILKEKINYEIVIKDEMIAMNDSVRTEIPEAIKFINTENEISPKKKERKPIRIIYKRGNKSSKTLVAAIDTTSRKKFFHSIKDATKNISSGDLIARIRDAKDDFFSQGIDFKKSK